MIIFFESPEIINYDAIRPIIKKNLHRAMYYDIYKNAHKHNKTYSTPDYNRTVFDNIHTIFDLSIKNPEQVFFIRNGLLYLSVKATIEEDYRILNYVKDMVSNHQFTNVHTIFATTKIKMENHDSDRVEQFIKELKLYNKCMENIEVYLNDHVKNNTTSILIAEDDEAKNKNRIETILNTIKSYNPVDK